MTGGLIDVWCVKCPEPAVAEYPQPDGTTAALCRECTTLEAWKAGNVNWDAQTQKERPL